MLFFIFSDCPVKGLRTIELISDEETFVEELINDGRVLVDNVWKTVK